MQSDFVKFTDLKRVVVIGSSCVGKTTFAKNLAETLNVKHIEMDRLNWLPEWQERSTGELRGLVKKETSAKRWVLDGNYSRVRDITWKRATHIIWLNLSFPIVFYRAVKRTTQRAYTGEDICNGNRETFKQSFLSTDSMILWVLRTFHSRRRRYKKQLEDNENLRLKFLVFRKPLEIEEFLESLKCDENDLKISIANDSKHI